MINNKNSFDLILHKLPEDSGKLTNFKLSLIKDLELDVQVARVALDYLPSKLIEDKPRPDLEKAKALLADFEATLEILPTGSSEAISPRNFDEEAHLKDEEEKAAGENEVFFDLDLDNLKIDDVINQGESIKTPEELFEIEDISANVSVNAEQEDDTGTDSSPLTNEAKDATTQSQATDLAALQNKLQEAESQQSATATAEQESPEGKTTEEVSAAAPDSSVEKEAAIPSATEKPAGSPATEKPAGSPATETPAANIPASEAPAAETPAGGSVSLGELMGGGGGAPLGSSGVSISAKSTPSENTTIRGNRTETFEILNVPVGEPTNTRFMESSKGKSMVSNLFFAFVLITVIVLTSYIFIYEEDPFFELKQLSKKVNILAEQKEQDLIITEKPKEIPTYTYVVEENIGELLVFITCKVKEQKVIGLNFSARKPEDLPPDHPLQSITKISIGKLQLEYKNNDEFWAHGLSKIFVNSAHGITRPTANIFLSGKYIPSIDAVHVHIMLNRGFDRIPKLNQIQPDVDNAVNTKIFIRDRFLLLKRNF